MMNKPVLPIRVLLVSRHSIVLLGLEKLIDGQNPRMEVIKKFTHCAEVFSQVKKLLPDVIILDLDFDTEEAMGAILQLTTVTKAKILAFTGSQDLSVHDRAMLNGARGVIRKEDAVETILRAIEKVNADQIWLDRAGTSRLFLELSRRESKEIHNPEQERIRSLTSREREIVNTLTAHAGTASKSLAAILHISESTLRNHLSSIYGKLGVTSRLGLWDYANKNGLNKTET